MGRIGGMGRTGAPAATPSRGHGNPRLGVSVSSRRAGVPNAAPALGWRRWGPAASARKMGRVGRVGQVGRVGRVGRGGEYGQDGRDKTPETGQNTDTWSPASAGLKEIRVKADATGASET